MFDGNVEHPFLKYVGDGIHESVVQFIHSVVGVGWCSRWSGAPYQCPDKIRLAFSSAPRPTPHSACSGLQSECLMNRRHREGP